MAKNKILSIFKMPPTSDKFINYATLFLSIIGFIMIASATMGEAVNRNMYLIFVVAKQIIFLLGGYFSMIILSKQFNFKILRVNTILLILLTVGALLFTLFFSFSRGARAWIRIPIGIDVTIQPSEFAKISIMLVIASYLGDVKTRYLKNSDFYKVPLVFTLISVFIVVVLQRDLGSGVVMFLIASICVLVPKHKQLRNLQLFIVCAAIVSIISAFVLLSPIGETIIKDMPFLQTYQKNRFLSSINPFTDRYDTGYQLIHGLIAFASGGFFGLGFGKSVRKYTNFPEANTDFILAIVVEELGFIGFLAIFIAYLTIIIRLFRYAFLIKSEKAQIVLIGTAMYIFIHFVLNVGGVTGLIPLTGVPLLMISSGGSSTLSLMMAIGLSQGVISKYKQGEIE